MALWFVLFFACSLAHVQAAASTAMGATATNLASVLHSSPCHAQHDLGAAPADACNALQNSPLNQQILTLLALIALFGLAAAFGGLFIGWPRQLRRAPPAPAISPGLPRPVRQRLHRYNE
ncbi:hypothetical protein [Pseudomonas sp.]|uniref:hypothetical protein n=1 Tax=Pseudomonas sp. TaxID=306 RepID=UPI003565D769